ncbi:cuticle protein 14-like [Tropilaelaps mercedesae]|uniref:Cuticle protein 14-like n=1 Tax=Tropilaelaps mercedesae TaxID=418985 RepID=A0A1V9XZE4_9ACAR|nr:cuticle protein 14-like [Tropilaelaps mercedesae]
MKAFPVFAALLVAGQAVHLGGISTGSSISSRAENQGYCIWCFGLNDIDGRARVINCDADGLGFRALIQTNEPGTAARAAAATSISILAVAAIAKTIAAAPDAVAARIAYTPYVAPAYVAAPIAAGYDYGAALATLALAAPLSLRSADTLLILLDMATDTDDKYWFWHGPHIIVVISNL